MTNQGGGVRFFLLPVMGILALGALAGCVTQQGSGKSSAPAKEEFEKQTAGQDEQAVEPGPEEENSMRLRHPRKIKTFEEQFPDIKPVPSDGNQ